MTLLPCWRVGLPRRRYEGTSTPPRACAKEKGDVAPGEAWEQPTWAKRGTGLTQSPQRDQRSAGCRNASPMAGSPPPGDLAIWQGPESSLRELGQDGRLESRMSGASRRIL